LASTFSPILKAIPGARRWDDIAPFINTGVLTNVYTWLEPFYRDFRAVGVVLGTFLLGLVISVLYRRRAKSARVFWIQAIFISSVFLATFGPKINNTQFISEVLFVLAITANWSELRRIKLPAFAVRRSRVRAGDQEHAEPEAAREGG